MFASLASFTWPLASLMTGPVLARALGPEGRGHVAALLAPLALANLLFPLGLPDALTFFTASGKLPKRIAVPIALLGGLLSGGIALAVLWFSTPYLFRLEEQYVPEFRWLLLSLPAYLIFAAIRGIVQGSPGGFSLINRERATAAASRFLILLGLFFFGVLTPLNSVWISVATQVGACLWLLPALRNATPFHFSTSESKIVLRYAGAAAAGTLGGLIVIRLDQALMVSLTSARELAFYAIAVSLAELPLGLVGAVRDVAFTEAAAQNDPAVTARFCRLTLATISAICLAGAALAPWAVPLLYGKAFAPAVAMSEILFIATAGRAVTTIMGAGLMTTNRTWSRSIIQLIGAAVTVVLLFVFVPRWGGVGAAWVTTWTYLLLAALSTFVFARATGTSVWACLIPSKDECVKLAMLIRARF